MLCERGKTDTVKLRLSKAEFSTLGCTLPIANTYSVCRQRANSPPPKHIDASKNLLRGHSGLELTKNSLWRAKLRALRNRVWFRVLSPVERGLLDLTIGWVDQVKSTKLANILDGILTKLLTAMNHGTSGALQRGCALAQRISEWASGWGNTAAKEWGIDLNFQRALGLGLLSL